MTEADMSWVKAACDGDETTRQAFLTVKTYITELSTEIRLLREFRDELQKQYWDLNYTVRKIKDTAGLNDPHWNNLSALAFAARLGLIDQACVAALKHSPAWSESE